MRPNPDAGRILPERRNPLLETPPPHTDLVDMRRLGQTNLGEKGTNSGPFSYVHLRVALPQPLEDQELFGAGAPESYFLMRRSKDGFVSSTGMFKASFPWARKAEEEAEKNHVKSHFKNTSKDETAGNLWVEPSDALTLAEEYGIKPWIEALLDNEPVAPSDHRKRSAAITPPPPFFRAPQSEPGSVSSIPAPSGGSRRRSTRSMSPSKRNMTPRKSRALKSALSRDSPLKKKEVASIPEMEDKTTFDLGVSEETTLESIGLINGATSNTTPVKNEGTIKVEVDETVETNGGVEVQTTHVRVAVPEGISGVPPSPGATKDMIAKAREMVEQAQELERKSAVAAKRKANESDEDSSLDEERKVKRTRGLEEQLRRERVKTRALLGLSATLAIGAILPYVL